VTLMQEYAARLVSVVRAATSIAEVEAVEWECHAPPGVPYVLALAVEDAITKRKAELGP
jgi:hypothetical protein